MAAVVLGPGLAPAGIADSKTLDEAAREALFEAILAHSAAVSVVLLPPAEIDRLNIRGATLDAMRRAVLALAISPDHVFVDGRDVPAGLSGPVRAVIGGDALIPAVSAASIIAKVTRDRLMRRLGTMLPAYGFEVHKGYPTVHHRERIAVLGGCRHHRMSFAPFRNGTVD